MNMQEQDNDRIMRLENAGLEARRYVLSTRPNAHILYTANKYGEYTHFAVYDCKLQLNTKGNFDKEQPAPQQLGDLIPFDSSLPDDIANKHHVNAWCSAADDLRRLNMRLSGVWLPNEHR